MNLLNEPRTKIDVIYQDLLGELGALVQRIEAAITLCNDVTDQAKALPMDVREAVAQTNRRLNEETMREFGRLTTRLDGLVSVASDTLGTAQKALRKVVVLAVVFGAIAGAVGGVVAGAILSAGF